MSDQNIAPAIHERKGHTPGPWYVVPYGDGDSLVICSDEAGEKRIAFMAVPGQRDQQKRRQSWKRIKANAHLIAAAPELLEALKAIKHSIGQARIPGNDWKRELALVENLTAAAITKAEG